MTDLKEIRHDDEETRVADPTRLCTHGPADQIVVDKVLAAQVDDPGEHDGRSGWRWFRFADGTLVLGVFPHGDTYLETELDAGRP